MTGHTISKGKNSNLLYESFHSPSRTLPSTRFPSTPMETSHLGKLFGLSGQSTPERVRLFFDQGYLFVDMSPEGINHARFRELFTMLFAFWFSRQSEQNFDLLGGCLLEKPNQRAASPDLVLYLGEDSPQHQQGEPRRINLDEWRLPELVGEVGDTTFATDLDEKKQLYAALEIPEYWVVDIRGKRVLAFRLQDDGKYQQCESSVALKGLPITANCDLVRYNNYKYLEM